MDRIAMFTCLLWIIVIVTRLTGVLPITPSIFIIIYFIYMLFKTLKFRKNYFFSYYYLKTDGSTGYGYTEITTTKSIKKFGDVSKFAKAIANTNGYKEVTILSWTVY